MLVKVGDKVYSSQDQPIMVVLAEQDKRNIANMLPDATRYAEFSDALGWTDEQKFQWMRELGPHEHYLDELGEGE
jgi:hypothetical protein